jgi:glutaredoxin
LYSREGCHLCDEMAAQLQALGVEFDKVDVDSDPQLRLRYWRDVPVLVFQDVVIKHRLSPEAIAKLR